MSARRVVFLDRDGTLNEDVGYPGQPDQIRLYPGSIEAVRRLKAAGFAVVVVTNQSGVGRGYFTEADLARVNGRVLDLFSTGGAPLDGLYYCPHHPGSAAPAYDRDCDCRKPRPEMGRRAAAELGLTLEGAYMIGDKAEDVLFGLSLGARSILVLTGYGRRAAAELEAQGVRPAFIAAGIDEAAAWICAAETGRAATDPTGSGGAKD